MLAYLSIACFVKTDFVRSERAGLLTSPLLLCAGHSEGPTGAGRVRGALYGPATGEQRLEDPEGHPACAALERHQRGPCPCYPVHHGDAVRRCGGLHRS